MNDIKQINFQKKCCDWVYDTCSKEDTKQLLMLKSPTGSGKTIILLSFIEKYLQDYPKTAFVWLCPGKGNLEEQSKRKMEKYLPGYTAQNLSDALRNGFEQKSTTFINWELVTKKGNKAITDNERKNLYERIDDAKRNDTEFIIIVDEEHSNDTKKANDIINSFVAKHIIRTSATINKAKNAEYYVIDETDVIDAQLITKAVWVNMDVDGTKSDALTEYKYLILLADKKRKEIAHEYQTLNKNIRPLVIIQMPNNSDALVKNVEKYLSDLGYTYSNNMVAKWLDKSKENLEHLEDNNGIPIFLIMKQAVATGWDCPRAKILVKLREGMGDVFTIQTIGRIRRMPEHKHYSNELLDYAYIYTFDDTFKKGLFDEEERAYVPSRVFLKDKCKSFTLVSEKRSDFSSNIDEKLVMKKIYEFYVDKYHISSTNAKDKLEANGYKMFGNEIETTFHQGKVIKTERADEDLKTFTKRRPVNTHDDGRTKMHDINVIASTLGFDDKVISRILQILFLKKKNKRRKYNLIPFSNTEFYAFIINNVDLLKRDFRESAEKTIVQNPMAFIEEHDFYIPEQELYRTEINPVSKDILNSNSYKEYNESMFIGKSTSEILFEQWCETNISIVDWVYKNGDNGINYFSITYQDGLNKVKEFYPDYILKLKDGSIWLVETKGGETNTGEDKNIDKQIKNKFNAFKNYCNKHNLNWGFVRDKNSKLYINNTEYVDDLSDNNWKKIDQIICMNSGDINE